MLFELPWWWLLWTFLILSFGIGGSVYQWRMTKKKSGVNPVELAIDHNIRQARGEIVSGPSTEQRLQELARLHRDGLITDEEYEAARKQALGLG